MVNGLVYPVPNKDLSGLGIHATVDLDGSVKFGPDVEWLSPSMRDYDPSFYNPPLEHIEMLKPKFQAAIENYLPELSSFGALAYDYSGVRPKLTHPDAGGSDFNGGSDFWIQQDSAGFYNLFGIESPGVTSSLAIAEKVVQMAEKR